MKDRGKLLMFFLIGSEAFFFIALIIAYVYYRNFTGATDMVAHFLNVKRATILTAGLVLSSFTLIRSKKNLLKGRWKKAKLYMGGTIILAAVFLAGQMMEYIELYHKQVTISKNVFGSSFFTLTGFHGLHVIMGLIAISLLFGFSFGKFKVLTVAGIGSVEAYWHFVDIVWLCVYTYVYLTPLL
ncbi:heme-copper oxidase subunit III [Zunongwangia sp. H14]|uniref:cytochrome c oxidase subunit 3 n=1 Tax=Zunongwangia sp. H14 TaxID=3240792 RepID=UPI0035671F17